MPDSLRQPAPGEFWRAPVREPSLEAVPPLRPRPEELCGRCRTELVMGARFCHVCGAPRFMPAPGRAERLHGALGLAAAPQRLGLSLPSFIAFVAGIACLLAALGAGLAFSATTLLDWQAVQLWRAQWLLAAVAAFAAGLLLKR